MEKTVNSVEDWLQDCQNSTDIDQLHTCVENDQDRLVNALVSLLEEKSRYPDLFENTVKQLFDFARSKDDKLRDFVLFFVPHLIYVYLSAVSMGDKKSVSSVELTLVALYNTEVLCENGVARVASFRLPTLARQSVYHEPASLAPASFTTDSLHRLEAGDAETVRWGPPKHMTTVTAATRYHLATALLVAFNARLSQFPKVVLIHLCKATSKLVCQGFSRPGHHHRSSYGSDGSFGVYPRPVPRIPVTSDLLAELVHAVYFSIPSDRSMHDLPPLVSFGMALYHYHFNRFNGFASLGIQALEDAHMRAQYELFADVLLMTNAIKNSLKVSPCDQSKDGPMGISLALTPSTNAAPLSKTYITNASFRTKKLPDDIPIQRAEAAQDGTKGLKSILEDQDGEDKDIKPPIRTPQGSGRDFKDKETKEKIKLSSNLPLTSLVKKRDKEKLRNGERRDSEKKGDKERKGKSEKDKENRNEPYSNRNSACYSTDLNVSSATIDGGVIKQQSPQQNFELKCLTKGSASLDGTKYATIDVRIEDQSDGIPQTKAAEMNGSQNQVGKVS